MHVFSFHQELIRLLCSQLWRQSTLTMCLLWCSTGAWSSRHCTLHCKASAWCVCGATSAWCVCGATSAWCACGATSAWCVCGAADCPYSLCLCCWPTHCYRLECVYGVGLVLALRFSMLLEARPVQGWWDHTYTVCDNVPLMFSSNSVAFCGTIWTYYSMEWAK